jgi:hypothetical protein
MEAAWLRSVISIGVQLKTAAVCPLMSAIAAANIAASSSSSEAGGSYRTAAATDGGDGADEFPLSVRAVVGFSVFTARTMNFNAIIMNIRPPVTRKTTLKAMIDISTPPCQSINRLAMLLPISPFSSF